MFHRVGLVLLFALIVSVGVWLFKPPRPIRVSAQGEQSRASKPLQTESVTPNSRPTLLGRDQTRIREIHALLGARACQSGTLQKIMPRTVTDEECTQEFSDVAAKLEMSVEHHRRMGIETDLETCTARDAHGNLADYSTAAGDIGDFTKMILWNGIPLELDEANRRRLMLFAGVALCSVRRSIDYWEKHPDEIPSGDDILGHLYFDLEQGKPARSYMVEAFFEAAAAAGVLRKK